MSWTPEQVEAYKVMLANESIIQRLLRVAREQAESAEWYFDQDSESKAAEWYYCSGHHYTQAMAYALGLILGFTHEEVDQQWAEAEEQDANEDG